MADGASRDRRPDPRRGLRRSPATSSARADGSDLLVALAYFGFFLNLFNLMPVGILDGGAIWRSTRWLWLGGGTREGDRLGVLFAGTAVLLAFGAYAAYLPQHRL